MELSENLEPVWKTEDEKENIIRFRIRFVCTPYRSAFTYRWTQMSTIVHFATTSLERSIFFVNAELTATNVVEFHRHSEEDVVLGSLPIPKGELQLDMAPSSHPSPFPSIWPRLTSSLLQHTSRNTEGLTTDCTVSASTNFATRFVRTYRNLNSKVHLLPVAENA
ncbi:hypothetical protein PLEOSDRAFT_1090879 [Pleurotus ostreatus PC15]|uniref:Uncharacterized protein n=1 Tax=Pleurotus ostreatus (strain PC15) TaxID=1137138 RepID=A0A067N975_PLEO1|nr:hypothetical protein PLEOSDRAFT_1090879 [Pleurotus ostreatus PC15]